MKQALCLLTGLLTIFVSVHAQSQCTPAPKNSDTDIIEETTTAADGSKRDLAAQLGVSSYEPIYFIAGPNNGWNLKFQISFKYQLFSETGYFSQCLHVPSHIYLSYSQTSLWDLDVLSAPFRDSSYRPRLFYSRDDLWHTENSKWRLGLEAGIAHESNGKGEPDSRSINFYYARPTLSYYVDQRHRIYVAPMFYNYINVGDENANIADYRGYADLLVGYGNGNDGRHDWNAWGTFRRGLKKHYGSMELNLALPLGAFSKGRINGWLLTQYFSGHGESLLEYDRQLDSQFRVGFAILVQ